MKRVLMVIPILDDKWIGGIIDNVQKQSNDILIDVLCLWHEPFASFPHKCNNLYYVLPTNLMSLFKIKYVGKLMFYFVRTLSIYWFVFSRNKKDRKYDVVNFHFSNSFMLKHSRLFKTIANKLLLSPWGSEFLRLEESKVIKIRKYIKYFDHVSIGYNDNFKAQIGKILEVPKEKFVEISFGSSQIDYISSHWYIPKEEAKRNLNIPSNKYVIVCGYNSSPAQNHEQIIKALLNIKDKIDNPVLLFPMTYANKGGYREYIRECLRKSGFEYIIYDTFLSDEEMFYIKRAADMFIHAQNTDASSASLAEALLCDSTVVNASWLRYSDKEKYGLPYYLFDSFDTLHEVILKAYNHGPLVTVDLQNYIFEEGWTKQSKKWVKYYSE